MKVLFLTDSLSDLDGVGRYTMRLIAAMQKLEPSLKPVILLARKHRPTSKSIPKDWHVEVALPPDYFFYMSRMRFLVSRLQSVWRVWRHAKGATLIHAIKDYPHNLVGAQAAKLAGIPCVATAHGTYSVQPLLDNRHEARARKTYGAFAAMISVSNYTRRRLVELLAAEDGGPQRGGLDPKRIYVVPNCVDASHYVQDRGIPVHPWHWRGQGAQGPPPFPSGLPPGGHEVPGTASLPRGAPLRRRVRAGLAPDGEGRRHGAARAFPRKH